VDAHGMPVRAIITSGTTADCKQAIPLISGIFAEMVLANKGYDTNKILEYATERQDRSVIPPKKNRDDRHEYDEYLYRLRHLVEVENAFLHLKRWRGIATRYAKRGDSFLAAVHIRCIALRRKALA